MQAQSDTQATKRLPALAEGVRAKLLRLFRTVHKKAALAGLVELVTGAAGKGVGLVHAMKRSATRRPLLVWISMTGFLAAAVYWAMPKSAQPLKAPALLQVKKGSFTVTLTEPGELRALDSITVSAQKDLPIIHLVPEGSHVKKGDVLVRFDPGKYVAYLEESQAALRVAQAEQRKAETVLEAQRQKLRAEIARFEAEVQMAQLDLDDLKKKPLPDELENARMQLEKAKVAYQHAEKRRNLLPELVERGFVTKESQEEAELQYYQAKADLQVAQFHFNKVSAGATPQELARAEIRLEQATFALERAQAGLESQLRSYAADIERAKANVDKARKAISTLELKLRRAELRAPKDGLVVYANQVDNSGDKIQLGMIPFEGQPLIYLPDLSTMVADTEVNEIDIGKVKTGGAVEVRPEAYPNAIFHGRVRKIGSLAKLKRTPDGTPSGIKVFDVMVEIEEKDPRLRPGLTAMLHLIVDRWQNAISVPVSAILSRGTKPVVLISKAGRIEERRVVLGPSNDHDVVVREGLHEGEQVIRNPASLGLP